eukprot:scaffold16270_cov80-Skeletonema_marinoi.AAC.1
MKAGVIQSTGSHACGTVAHIPRAKKDAAVGQWADTLFDHDRIVIKSTDRVHNLNRRRESMSRSLRLILHK